MADEVRKLAEKTQQAINQISVSIQAMQQEIEVIEHSSSEVSKIANNSGEKINEFLRYLRKWKVTHILLRKSSHSFLRD